MRLFCLFTQFALLFFWIARFCANESPWTLPAGGSVLLRAITLLILLEGSGWFLEPPMAALCSGIIGLLWLAYVCGQRLARAVGLITSFLGAALFCLCDEPAGLQLYAIACAAMFLPAAGSWAPGLVRGLKIPILAIICIAGILPGALAWAFRWTEASLLLPVALLLIFLFRYYARAARPQRAAVAGVAVSAWLFITMPPLGIFTGLGALVPLLCGTGPGAGVMSGEEV